MCSAGCLALLAFGTKAIVRRKKIKICGALWRGQVTLLVRRVKSSTSWRIIGKDGLAFVWHVTFIFYSNISSSYFDNIAETLSHE